MSYHVFKLGHQRGKERLVKEVAGPRKALLLSIKSRDMKILSQEWKKLKEQIEKKRHKGAGRNSRWNKEGTVLRCNKKLWEIFPHIPNLKLERGYRDPF